MTSDQSESAPTLADDAVLAPFRERDDPVLTTDEVLASLPFGRPAARESLQRLNAQGVVERKAVGDDAVWWLPGHTDTDERAEPMAGATRRTEGLSHELETAIQTLDDIDERERAAIYAACHFLHAHGPATAETLRERVYPEQSGGCEDENRWWTECVRPALDALPGVERTAEGWRLV